MEVSGLDALIMERVVFRLASCLKITLIKCIQISMKHNYMGMHMYADKRYFLNGLCLRGVPLAVL